MEPKKYLNDLIIDIENAIRHLDPKMQNTYRYLATKRINRISKQNKHNTLHKRQQYIINEMKKTFQRNHITIARADKSKTTVLINKNILQEKVYEFLQENNIKQINKDPTDKHQKQIHLALQKSENIIEKKSTQVFNEHKTKSPTT